VHALGGRFDEGDDPDLLMIANAPTGQFPLALGPWFSYLLPGSAGGRFRGPDVVVAPLDTAGFAPGCALFVSGDLDGDGLAELVGVDSAADPSAPLCEADPAAADDARLWVHSPASGTSTVTALGSWRDPRQLALADLDGDARPELIVTFADDVVIFANDGAGLDPAGTALGAASPRGAVALVEAPPGPPSIAVLGADGLDVYPAGGGAPRRAHDLPADQAQVASLVAGDFDRDGVVDLVVHRGARVTLLAGGVAEP
jgi:hypothetical protein